MSDEARYAIVAARFYEDLADRLIAGAQAAFAEAGAPTADVYSVPGAFELPAAATVCANRSTSPKPSEQSNGTTI